jgi:uncharacterized protein YndB with AHSA1/START domain
MNKEFIYTTYIKASAQKVWDAITMPEFTRQYWAHDNVSDWQVGSEWRHIRCENQNIDIIGTVLESNPPHRLVVSWAGLSNREDLSQVVYEIMPVDDLVRLMVIHTDLSESMGNGVIKGWPLVLSSLKSYLETGTAIDVMSVRKCA